MEKMQRKTTEPNHGLHRSTDLINWISSWEMILIFSVSAGIVIFSPDTVLSTHPLLATFVATIAQHFPSIGHYQAKSQFPEVTGLYFSIVPFITPMVLVQMIRTRANTLTDMRVRRRRHPVKWLTSVILIIPVVIFGLYILIEHNNGIQLSGMPIDRSKFALTVFGWIFAGGAIWGGVGILIILSMAVLKNKSKEDA
ncbi:hypothetical protein [Burkholderia anthina]|uniref:hypothetical protein n=1 Tax=Burkholderia anthina TaxID=179879 RepID=UPI00158BCCDA|nr:hypothetical protein [Burkholderia anthina]